MKANPQLNIDSMSKLQFRVETVIRQKRPKYTVISAPIKGYMGFADYMTSLSSSLQLNNYDFFIFKLCIA